MFKKYLTNTQKFLGLKKKSSLAQIEIGILDNQIILRFQEPIKYIQLDKVQSLDLLVALTQKISLIKK